LIASRGYFVGFDRSRVLRLIETRTEAVLADLTALDRFVSSTRLSDQELTIVGEQMHAAEQSISAMASAVKAWRQYSEAAWHGASARRQPSPRRMSI
jgi:hypothetical protein